LQTTWFNAADILAVGAARRASMTCCCNPGSAHRATMKKLTGWGRLLLILLPSLFILAPAAIRASDHADPMALSDPEANITDLFFFPKGDQMILIFNVRRALTAPKPYNLEAYDYVIHMDLTTSVSVDDPQGHEGNRARYGGTVMKPELIHDDVTITLHLNNDTSLKDKDFKGRIRGTDSIRIYTGVRDDPFIFPRFFKKNIVAMVLSIPMASFPDGQRDFILWGTTHKGDRQLDHVGRSNRTQQARFDSLNKLPPSQHVAETMKLMETWDPRYKFFNGFNEQIPKSLAALIQLQLQMRKYDLVPDVMIYSSRSPVGFPNGRVLTDDVAAQTCATGDCILQELSLIEGGWPRQTVNDKPFLDDFPYLAEPWPDAPETPLPTASLWPYIIGILIIFIIVSWAIVEILRRLVIWLAGRRRPATA
jgi:hypothetical protein